MAPGAGRRNCKKHNIRNNINMAQIQTLKDRESGKAVYPVTISKAVFDDNGVDLDTLLAQQKRDTEGALKEYPKKTEVTQALVGKQDKLSTTTDLHITNDSIIGLTRMAEQRSFIATWNEVAGIYGKYDLNNAPDVEHPFMCNKLWLTYEEAIAVLETGKTQYEQTGVLPQKLRTNLFIETVVYSNIASVSLQRLFCYSNAEILRVSPDNSCVKASSLYNTFWQCKILREVLGRIDVTNCSTLVDVFSGNEMLESIRLYGVKANLSLAGVPRIDSQSLGYMVANAINASAISIIVHPDVYAKLTDETNPEWHQVMLDAASKNITFATT